MRGTSANVREMVFAGAVSGVIAGALAMVSGLELGPSLDVDLGDFVEVLFGTDLCFGMQMLGGCIGPVLSLWMAIPGLVFGFCIAATLDRQGALDPAQAFGLIAGGATSCVAAFVVGQLALGQITFVDDFMALALSGAIGGAAGGGLLAALIGAMHWSTGFWRLAAVGLVAGALIPIAEFISWIGFFAIWQAACAAMLAIVFGQGRLEASSRGA